MVTRMMFVAGLPSSRSPGFRVRIYTVLHSSQTVVFLEIRCQNCILQPDRSLVWKTCVAYFYRYRFGISNPCILFLWPVVIFLKYCILHWIFWNIYDPNIVPTRFMRVVFCFWTLVKILDLGSIGCINIINMSYFIFSQFYLIFCCYM